MSTQESLEVVKTVLGALQRGDVPAVLAALADDVEWFIPGPPDKIPFSGLRRGREQVVGFFVVLDATLEFLRFEAREYIAHEDRVVAWGQNRDRMKSTERVIENDWACIFTVRDGKIAKLRMYEDTAAFVIALDTNARTTPGEHP